MPSFRYGDPEPRIYHAYGYLVDGAVIDADQAPDHRFTEVDGPTIATVEEEQ
jgi:hypothetical protein